MTRTELVDVVEHTDPGCVWAWSSEPKLRWLRARYGPALRWRRVLGLQLDGTAAVHAIGPAAATAVRAGWIEVAGHTGAPIPRVLRHAPRSTRPASLAVKAAELQGPEVADRVLRRLRESWFVDGRPADTMRRVGDALAGVEGLDLLALLADAVGPAAARALAADLEEARAPDPAVVGLDGPGPHPGAARGDGVRLRYAFPTVVVRGPAGRRIVPGWRPTASYDDAIRAVAPDVRPAAILPLSADAALEAYRSLTISDLELLTGSQLPPLDAVPLETATAPLFVHPADTHRHAHDRPATLAALD